MAFMNYDFYLDHLTRVLTPARLRHSLGAMQVTVELAGFYGYNPAQAATAGLLHDCAKDLSQEEQERMAREGGFVPANDAERDYNLYGHGVVGAYYARAVLGVTDPLVLDAIGMHCYSGDAGPGGTGRFFAPLCCCVRFADVLEPNRNWDGTARAIGEGLPALRAAAYAGRLEEAVLLHAVMIARFMTENGLPLHPNYHRVLALVGRWT